MLHHMPVIRTVTPVARTSTTQQVSGSLVPQPASVPNPPIQNVQDTEYSSDDDEAIVPFDITSKIIDKKDEKTFFVKLAFREAIIYTRNWRYNRIICQEKVNDIYKSLCEGYPIPFVLHAVLDETNKSNVKIDIIDGQHRMAAVTDYIAKNDVNMDCPYCVWICLYKIDNAETNNTNVVIDIFKRINNNRPFDERELPNTLIIDLVKSICDVPLFKRNKVIKSDDKHEKAHVPCIHKKELNALLNQHQDHIRSSGKTIQELTNNIVIINHKLSMIRFEDLYSVGNRQTETKRYQTAVAKNFFLNLKNSKYPPEVWIKYIVDPSRLS